MMAQNKLKSKEKEKCSEIVAFFTLNEMTKKALKKKYEENKYIDDGLIDMLEKFDNDE